MHRMFGKKKTKEPPASDEEINLKNALTKANKDLGNLACSIGEARSRFLLEPARKAISANDEPTIKHDTGKELAEGWKEIIEAYRKCKVHYEEMVLPLQILHYQPGPNGIDNYTRRNIRCCQLINNWGFLSRRWLCRVSGYALLCQDQQGVERLYGPMLGPAGSTVRSEREQQ
ncbi:hypothetical protein P280DRAFT_16612 [Massarina eburnea CBS 473.64]|uniref:Uncharacterized protein n=1 Tax=Massarina eburnea CBS 473.64 TaxID=1395130 RepID=A0A6A6SGM1_9PLEO|nr:hypothetical protein P280DRAFT_16612 [Massarina eburnea CBS 473.64]